MTEHCGWPTAKGTACEHPVTDEETGRCWEHKNDAKVAGRPSKFNDDRAQDAIDAARQAKSKAGCARAAGVHHTTLLNWLDENPTFTDEHGEEREFFTAFERARRDGETILIQGGLRDADVDSSMAKFLLSTSFDYVKTERREVTGEGGGPINLDLTEEIVETGYES